MVSLSAECIIHECRNLRPCSSTRCVNITVVRLIVDDCVGTNFLEVEDMTRLVINVDISRHLRLLVGNEDLVVWHTSNIVQPCQRVIKSIIRAARDDLDVGSVLHEIGQVLAEALVWLHCAIHALSRCREESLQENIHVIEDPGLHIGVNCRSPHRNMSMVEALMRDQNISERLVEGTRSSIEV